MVYGMGYGASTNLHHGLGCESKTNAWDSVWHGSEYRDTFHWPEGAWDTNDQDSGATAWDTTKTTLSEYGLGRDHY